MATSISSEERASDSPESFAYWTFILVLIILKILFWISVCCWLAKRRRSRTSPTDSMIAREAAYVDYSVAQEVEVPLPIYSPNPPAYHETTVGENEPKRASGASIISIVQEVETDNTRSTTPVQKDIVTSRPSVQEEPSSNPPGLQQTAVMQESSRTITLPENDVFESNLIEPQVLEAILNLDDSNQRGQE